MNSTLTPRLPIFKLTTYSFFNQNACETFCLAESEILEIATSTLRDNDSSWNAHKMRLIPIQKRGMVANPDDIGSALAKIHKRNVVLLKVKENDNLQHRDSE